MLSPTAAMSPPGHNRRFSKGGGAYALSVNELAAMSSSQRIEVMEMVKGGALSIDQVRGPALPAAKPTRASFA